MFEITRHIQELICVHVLHTLHMSEHSVHIVDIDFCNSQFRTKYLLMCSRLLPVNNYKPLKRQTIFFMASTAATNRKELMKKSKRI